MPVIGVLSDTHSLLRPEATAALEGVDALIHAGDVGSPEVLDSLREVAPLWAIRGNIDTWATEMPDVEAFELFRRSFYVIHDVRQLDLDPAAAELDVVISGHSHRPSIENRNGVLFLNPGSAGPRRFTLPITVAKLEVSESGLSPSILDLGDL